MQPRKNWIWFIALVTVVSLAGACGGAAEEPAEAPAPEAAEEPVAEATQEPAAMPELEPEPAEPAAPQLEGNIVDSGDFFDWLTSGSRTENATYYWTLSLTNDTTQTLDITVTFQFLDDTEDVVKTETKTVRLSPAASTDIREEGSMSHEDSLKVSGYTYTYDWNIVQG